MSLLAISLPIIALGCYLVTISLILLIAFAAATMLDCIVRRINASVAATIAGLPPESEDDWADEWLAELAAVIKTPFTAARLAQGLRQSGTEMGASHDGVKDPNHRKQSVRRSSGRTRRVDLTIAIIAVSYVVITVLGSIACLLALGAVLALYATAMDVVGFYVAAPVAMIAGGMVVAVVMSTEEIVESVRGWRSASRRRRAVRRALASTR